MSRRRYQREFSALQYPDPIPVSGFQPVGAAQASWWWDTRRYQAAGAPQYIIHDQMARLKLLPQPDLRRIVIGAIATSSPAAVLGNTIDVAFDGVAQSLALSVGPTALVRQTVTLAVPPGVHTIELFEQGGYITDITPDTGLLVVPYQSHTSSCAYFGASGTEGYYAWDPSNFVGGVLVFLLSWVGRMKTSGRFSASYVVASDGYGLQDYIAAPSSTTCAAWVAANVAPRCTGSTEQTVVYEFGAGDYFHGVWTAAQITSFYGMLADATHAALPNARIFFKTLVVMNSPVEGTVSASGCTQQQMRDAITAVAVGRSWVTITKGYNGGAADAETTSTGDLQDGKHLTPVAHRDKAFPYMRSVL